MPRTTDDHSTGQHKESAKKRIVILVSGSGSNAEKIMEYFRESNEAEVVAILTNNKNSAVLVKALRFRVPAFHFSREELYHSGQVEKMLSYLKPDLLVLAGFLWLMPQTLVKKYKRRILNIHPALLPKFGGKGMYGMKVHEAVITAGDKESGITIHLIDDQYDKGSIIFQEKMQVKTADAAALQLAVQELEHNHFPKVIADYLKTI